MISNRTVLKCLKFFGKFFKKKQANTNTDNVDIPATILLCNPGSQRYCSNPPGLCTSYNTSTSVTCLHEVLSNLCTLSTSGFSNHQQDLVLIQSTTQVILVICKILHILIFCVLSLIKSLNLIKTILSSSSLFFFAFICPNCSLYIFPLIVANLEFFLFDCADLHREDLHCCMNNVHILSYY